jgi:hypothetical protein
MYSSILLHTEHAKKPKTKNHFHLFVLFPSSTSAEQTHRIVKKVIAVHSLIPDYRYIHTDLLFRYSAICPATPQTCTTHKTIT